MFERYLEPPMRQMVEQKEGIVRNALDECIPGWTRDDVLKRCRWTRIAGSPVETLEVDGKPILEMHPLEFSGPVLEGDRYVCRVTQAYRKLT
jgi:hypothetical protein